MKHLFALRTGACKFCDAPGYLVQDGVISPECPGTDKTFTANQLLDGQHVQNVLQSPRTDGELAPTDTIKASR